MTLEKEKAGGCSLQRFVGRLGSTAELYNNLSKLSGELPDIKPGGVNKARRA